MNDHILEIQNLTKEFPGVCALDKVSFKVKTGEIHCLCGENGAGKSTLMSCISGVYPKGSYSGKVFFKGKETGFGSVKDSEKQGLAIIHQELALSPHLSIYENIFLGHMKTRAGIIDWDKCLAESKKYLERVGLHENPATIVNKIGVGKQQLVEIARALSKKAELLILDEPTSALNDEDSAKLLKLILELKKEGITSIMISHKLNEVLRIADTVTILRDGKSVSSYNVRKSNLDEAVIIKDMVGRDMTSRYPERTRQIGGVIMQVNDWTVYHPDYHAMKVVNKASFTLKKGEIIAFCGPIGAGRTELMMSLFGKSYGYSCSGELYLKGKKAEPKSPRQALKLGLGYLSEDRKALGLILIQDVRTNISISSLSQIAKMGVISAQQEIDTAETYRNKLNIKTPSIYQITRNLSGGNQQKVVLGRVLFALPEVLIVDEPTRGIDVGAKYEIYVILNELAAQGKSIIMVTSELPEAIGMADRIYVMNEGEIRGELSHGEATQEKIMRMALIKEKSQTLQNEGDTYAG